ncbi:nuclear receptor-interacting protein 2 [Sorex fumeus]|uniref:nuclear receptor-interacting protein 2 n=1 Tax=Sorex fumeus TaxID=62283 RepID=UPI0024ACCFA9|nr:nuclear receptor-interacting protein 2 [Sorex fumeus]
MSAGSEASRGEAGAPSREPPAAAATAAAAVAARRGPAHLGQQRRLKQATQFLHQDSADLLPIDSLKRLGTSKDPQPRSVIQRRLAEGNKSGRQGESALVQALIRGQESRREASKTQIPALLVSCKCRDQVLRAAVDTGTQHNQISAGCLRRLGLGVPAAGPAQVQQLELQLGQETVSCSARVVDAESPEFCLGLQTLLSLKCCIDLERGVLRPRAPFPELPFLPGDQEPDP